MLKTDKILGKRYSFAENWEEITIKQGVALANIELSKEILGYFKGENEALADELEHIYLESVLILSNIPREIANRLEFNSLKEFYEKYISPYHLGILFLNNSYGKSKGGRIKNLPKYQTILGTEYPFKEFTAEQFCDCVEALSGCPKGMDIFTALIYEDSPYNLEARLSTLDKIKRLPITYFWACLDMMNKAVEQITKVNKWIFDGEGVDAKLRSAIKRSGLENFGTNAWLYEVAQSCILDLNEVKKMNMYDFCNVLSYIRCQDKLVKYANK